MLMFARRCGIYAGPPWPTTNLKYYFKNYTLHLPRPVVRKIVRTAVEVSSSRQYY